MNHGTEPTRATRAAQVAAHERFWLIVSLLLVLMVPHSQSLWIDEAYTLPYATDRTPTDVATRLAHDDGSEALMPFAMFSTWAAAKVFGTSELGLRWASALWVAVSVVLFWRLAIVLGSPWAVVIFACHPFLFYYGGEARPYATVIAMGTGVSLGFVMAVWADAPSLSGVVVFVTFGILLCATHALGVIPFAVSAIVLALTYFKRGWRPTWSMLLVLGAGLAVLLVLGSYYVFTLERGTENTLQGLWHFNPASALFSVYELLGFVGFGPGRFELRQLAMDGGVAEALSGFVRWTSLGGAWLLLVYLIIVVDFALGSISFRSRQGRFVLQVTGVLVGSMALAWMASVAIGTPLWGRHVAALLPWVVLFWTLALTTGNDVRRRLSGVLALSLATTYLASSLIVRFHPDHRRDDYRSAAQLATESADAGQVVWWSASSRCAKYYGVEFCDPSSVREQRCVYEAVNLLTAEIERLPPADVVLMSKPELHDRRGHLSSWIEDQQLTPGRGFMAFDVYRPHAHSADRQGP
jgi:hypothetical protein